MQNNYLTFFRVQTCRKQAPFENIVDKGEHLEILKPFPSYDNSAADDFERIFIKT